MKKNRPNNPGHIVLTSHPPRDSKVPKVRWGAKTLEERGPLIASMADKVTAVASSEGLVETRPKTDEEWARVKAGAITLAEAANLLMIPRRTAHPGVKSIAPGVELEPEEMDVLIAKNRLRAVWR